MNYQYDTIYGKSYLVELRENLDAQSPLEWAGEEGAYAIIDTRICRESNCELADSFDTLERNFEKIFGVKKGKKSTTLAASEAGYTVLPIWGYSHGGYSFYASCENPYDKWDSGLAGLIWCKKGTFGDDVKYLQGVVTDYSEYYNGENYAIEFTSLEDGESFVGVEDIYGEPSDADIKDWCRGYLGEGELKPFEGKLKQHLSEEGFYEKVRSLIEDYHSSGVPTEKVEMLKGILED